MFFFTKNISSVDSTNVKSIEPICIEMGNPIDKKNKDIKKELYYLGRKERPEPDTKNNDMRIRIKKKIPPKKLEDIDIYDKKLHDYELKHGFRILVKDIDRVFMPTPKANGRQILICAAPSGAGKSVFCNQYIKLFHKLHPNRKIYIISHLESDPSLEDGLSKLIDKEIVQRLKINHEIVDDYMSDGGFKIEELKDSCLLCDDYDSINDKKIRSFIEHILDCCMKIGRHENINLLITSHLLYSGGSSKIHNRLILSEANGFCLFPSRSTVKALKYLGENYLGIDGKKMNEMRTWNDRYVYINKSPCYIIGQYRCEVF